MAILSKDLQPKEVEFLKFQKTRGFDSKTSFAKLQKARDAGLFELGDKQQAPDVSGAQQEQITTPSGAQVTKTTVAEEKPSFLETAAAAGKEALQKTIVDPAKKIIGGVEEAVETGAEAISGIGEEVVKKNLDALIDKVVGREFDPTNKTNTEDVVDLLQNTITAGFNIAAPGLTTVLNTLGQDPIGKEILELMQKPIVAGGEQLNKLPGLKQMRDSLDEEGKKKFDAVTGQLATLGGAKVLPKILETTGLKKTPTQKAIDTGKKAETLVEEFVKPTKESTKTVTKQITPEILKRGLKGTREELKIQAEANIKSSGKAIDTFIKEGKVKGELPIDKLVDVLAKEEGKLKFKGKTIPGNEAQVKFIESQLDFLGRIEKEFGNKLAPNEQVILKRAFDTVFDKTITRDKITKFQDDLKVKLADSLRSELAKNNPDLAKLNQEFSFNKNLDFVLGETIRRTTGQEPGLLRTAVEQGRAAPGAAAGATVGALVGGAPGAAIGAIFGGVVGGKLQRVVQNPKWKLVDANKKATLAKTIAEGNPTKLNKLLDSFIVTQGIDL